MDSATYRDLHIDGVGGGEIAAVVGLDPYKSARQVWDEKTLKSEPEEVEGYHIDRGNFTEAGNLAWGSHRTGIKFEKIKEPLRAGPFIVTPDGVGVDSDGNRIAAEVKAPSPYAAFDWGEDGTGSAGVPLKHLPQMMVEIGALGAPYGYEFAPIGGLLRAYRVPLNPGFYNTLTEAAERFMEHVKADTPPPIGHGRAAAEYLKNHWGANHPELIEDPDEDLDAFCWQLRKRDDQAKALKKEITGIQNEIKDRIKDQGGVAGKFGKIYWRHSKASGSTDWEAVCTSLLLRASVGELPTAEDIEEIKAQAKIIKPGPRVFRGYWSK